MNECLCPELCTRNMQRVLWDSSFLRLLFLRYTMHSIRSANSMVYTAASFAAGQVATAANARLLRPWLKGAQLCHLSASGTYASMVAWNRLSPALPPAANNLPCREATPHDERGTHIDATSLHCPSLGSNATTDLSLCRSFVMPPTVYTRPVRAQFARHHYLQHSMQKN